MSPISRGLMIMALGIAFMSVMDGMIKHLTASLSAPQVLFFRSFFGMLPLFVIAARKGGWRTVKTRRPVMHAVRALLGVVAFGAFTIGLRDMSLANALAICFAAPFFMVGFSTLLIGEQIGIHRIGAMLAGFIGVLVVLRPDEGVLNDGAIYMLIVAAAYALSQIIARKYRESESALSYSFWTTLGMTVFGMIAMVFFWRDMTLELWFWGFAMGIFGGLGHYYMVEAARVASPIAVSPMEYTALIWAAVFDWAFWQLIPQTATIAGSLVIVASGFYIMWRERLHYKKGREVKCTPA